ncbi:MAG TPA: RteC domain-containing protein [Candidatus Brocadiaceae bacterium]
MKKEFELLFNKMIEEIESCTMSGMNENEMAESCFWLTCMYWRTVKELIKERGFKNEKEEIEFFKEIKPRFTSKIEYFVLLTSGLEFVPTDKEKAIEYWKEEEMKYQRFRVKNEDFICYYDRGSNEMDVIYFKRVNEDRKPLLKLISYDGDPEFCSAQDYLVRNLIANRMYHEYVKGRLLRYARNDVSR